MKLRGSLSPSKNALFRAANPPLRSTNFFFRSANVLFRAYRTFYYRTDACCYRADAWGRRENARRAISALRVRFSDERGSAVVEFVVLTLPLFIPFALYLGFVNSQSQASFDAHNLARQVARAYISSPSEELTTARVNTVVDAFTSRVLEEHGVRTKPAVQVHCSAHPCLTPGALVKVTVAIENSAIKPAGYLRFFDQTPTRVSASDTQVVDIWRNTH